MKEVLAHISRRITHFEDSHFLYLPRPTFKTDK